MYGVELRVDSQYPIKCPYGMRMPMASDSKNPAPDLHAMARFRTNRRRDDRRVPGVLNPDLPQVQSCVLARILEILGEKMSTAKQTSYPLLC